MPKLHSSLRGFNDELEKIAGLADFVAKNQGMLGSAGALLGHGATAGAVLGGLHGAYKGYREAKDQGAGTGAAALHGLGGAVGGLSTGALGGALIGGGAGAALHTLRPQAAESMRKALSSTESRFGALGRFGQRQMHGLTGWTPPEGYASEAIRGGSWKTKQVADAAAGTKNFEKALADHELQKKIESKGLTNIPGVLKALKGENRGEAVKLLAKHTWANADPLMKAQLALAPVGVGAALMAPSDEHKGERIGSTLGNVVGGTIGTALPFGAGQLAMAAGAGVGKRVGRLADRIRGHSHTDASELASSEGQHIPSQRDVTPAVPEGIR
jgi:hypothetical protein